MIKTQRKSDIILKTSEPCSVRIFFSETNQVNTLVLFYVSNIRNSIFWSLKLADMYTNCLGDDISKYIPLQSYVFVSHIPTIPDWFSREGVFQKKDIWYYSPEIKGDSLIFSPYLSFIDPKATQSWEKNIFFVSGLSLFQNKFADIYHVCSKLRNIKASESQTFSKLAFSSMLNLLCVGIEDFKAKYFALALDLDYKKDTFEISLRFFVKCGFFKDKMSTSLHTYSSVNPFLRLESNCADIKKYNNITKFVGGEDLGQTSDIVLKTIQKGLVFYSSFQEHLMNNVIIQIIITRNFNNYVQNLLKRETETSASLFLLKNDQNNTFTLHYLCDSQYFGTEHSVSLSYKSSMYMHTHPELSLRKIDLHYGWWSSMDVSFDIISYITNCSDHLKDSKNNLILYLSMVASKQGYYINQPTEDLYMLILKAMKENNTSFLGFFYSSLVFLAWLFESVRLKGEHIFDDTDIGLIHYYLSSFSFITINSLIELFLTFLLKICTFNNEQFLLFKLTITALQPYIAGFYTNYLGKNPDKENSIYGICDNHLLHNQELYTAYLLEIINDYRAQKGIVFKTRKFAENNNCLHKALIIVNYVDEFYKNPSANQASFFYYNVGNGLPLQNDNINFKNIESLISDRLTQQKDCAMNNSYI